MAGEGAGGGKGGVTSDERWTADWNVPGLIDVIAGVVNSVTAADASITVAGTASAPTLSAARNVPIAKTANYTMVAADSLILANATGAGFTVTLPATPIVGQRYGVKKTDASANTVTVAGSAGNIDGAANKVISTQYQSLDFQSDGTNWWIV